MINVLYIRNYTNQNELYRQTLTGNVFGGRSFKSATASVAVDTALYLEGTANNAGGSNGWEDAQSKQ